jgi:hypothetical protein
MTTSDGRKQGAITSVPGPDPLLVGFPDPDLLRIRLVAETHFFFPKLRIRILPTYENVMLKNLLFEVFLMHIFSF